MGGGRGGRGGRRARWAPARHVQAASAAPAGRRCVQGQVSSWHTELVPLICSAALTERPTCVHRGHRQVAADGHAGRPARRLGILKQGGGWLLLQPAPAGGRLGRGERWSGGQSRECWGVEARPELRPKPGCAAAPAPSSQAHLRGSTAPRRRPTPAATASRERPAFCREEVETAPGVAVPPGASCASTVVPVASAAGRRRGWRREHTQGRTQGSSPWCMARRTGSQRGAAGAPQQPPRLPAARPPGPPWLSGAHQSSCHLRRPPPPALPPSWLPPAWPPHAPPPRPSRWRS